MTLSSTSVPLRLQAANGQIESSCKTQNRVVGANWRRDFFVAFDLLSPAGQELRVAGFAAAGGRRLVRG